MSASHQDLEKWVISSGKVPNYTGVVVANGRIGILPEDKPFRTRSIILNNVYEREFEGGVSKIVSGMNFAHLKLFIDGEEVTEDNVSGFHQELNMREASFTTTLIFEDKAKITYSLFALRNIPYSGYMDISITPLQDITVKATGCIMTPEDFVDIRPVYQVLEDLETTMPILQTNARTQFGKHAVSTSAGFVWHHINSTRVSQRPALKQEVFSEFEQGLSFEVQLEKGSVFEFAWMGAQCTSADFDDPLNESERMVVFNMLSPRDHLLQQHKALWEELWQGDIIIDGNLQDQLDIRLALYHLYAFSRSDSDLSIAPMGLSSQNYNGHIFWDTELWMYPPLLLLNQGIARSLINYRTDRLDKAKQKAANFGYKGAMYPWESDDTGEECTPSWALTGTFEHHITADIAIAFWNYFRVTQDNTWLLDEGYPVLKEIADFWVSRSTKNPDGSYSILNVVGANEFAPNVNDNAFTNGAAITALDYACKAAKMLSKEPNPLWNQVASGIQIHRFPDGTTKEHESYDGDMIKQADVNLLSYPLDIINDPETIRKDLAYYEPKLAEEGPAMGLSVFAIIHARLGNSKEAYRLFKGSYEPNKRPPFGALAESALSNNPYFATGAGGMLQAVLFGFGGLHLDDEGISQHNPVLPEQWESLTITGIGMSRKSFHVGRI